MSTPQNGYCTLAELLAFMPNSASANTSQAEQAIDAATRAIEGQTGKTFYPAYTTNYYDIPPLWFRRELQLVDDLLELTTLTNGDASVIASTEYDLAPYNAGPKKRIILKSYSTISFEPSTLGGSQKALSVYGVWGMHKNYSAAWATGSTLNGAITTTTATSVPVTSGTGYAAGNIIKVDAELMQITNVATNTLTVIRGWNGSAAATHLTLAQTYIWRYEGDIVRACLIQAARYFRRAEAVFGTTGGGEMGAQPVTLTQLDPDVKLICEAYTEDY
jgi:hypothetical protein